MSLGPYSTKYKTTEKLAGSYIDVGDPYVKAISSKGGRSSGKQFVTNPPILGQTGKFFDKKTYSTSPFQEVRKYSETQKRSDRKTGFGSNDFSKRDEFLMTIREGQWKEVVDKEHYFTDKAVLERERASPLSAEEAKFESDSLPHGLPAVERPHLPYFQTQIPSHLYDIGNTPQGNTPMCIKCQRDVFFCPHRAMAGNQEVIARRPVKERITSMEYGKYITKDQLARPEFAYSHVAKTFFDSSHLNEHRIGSW